MNVFLLLLSTPIPIFSTKTPILFSLSITIPVFKIPPTYTDIPMFSTKPKPVTGKTPPQDDVIAHYRQCAGSHVLKIVLNSEAAGNMGGLVNDLISAFSVGML